MITGKKEKKILHILRKLSVLSATLLVSMGLLIAIITLYNKPADFEKASDISKLIYNFFELLGFTIFTSGIFSFFLQLPDWQHYFEERLKNVVLEQEYLNSMDQETLSNLQIKTLKAYFHTSDIDKEGSFLNYFQDNLSKYISEPYRDNVKCEIVVEESDEPPGILISDRLTYACKMVGGKIQDTIKWKPDPGEFLDIISVEMKVKNNPVLSMNKKDDEFVVKCNGTEKQVPRSEIEQKGLIFPLSNFSENGLYVELKSVYKMETGQFSNWSMAHPTKTFYMTISYPKEMKLRFQPMVSHPEKVIEDHREGFFSMQYNEWLLPNSGVVYSFVPKN